MKLELRDVFKGIAARAQRANAARLSAGQAVSGGKLPPRDEGGVPGVRTGAMASDLTNPANVRVTENGFRIVPGASVRKRLEAFVLGNGRQPPRPFVGVSGELVDEARAQVARETARQIAKHLAARGRR